MSAGAPAGRGRDDRDGAGGSRTVLVPVPPPGATPGGAGAVAPRRRRRALHRLVPYLYVLPAVLLLGVWVGRPLVETLVLSFHDWDLLPTTPRRWVGLDQYRTALELPELWRALGNTGLYVLGLLVFSVVLPLLATAAFDRVGPRLRGFHRAALFVPFLIAPVAAAILWRWLLAPDVGLVNRATDAVGLGQVAWLYDALPAFLAILVIAGWKLLGFATLIVSAGRAQIDAEYARAAAVDGASPRQITRWITLPLLSPTIALMALMTVLVAGQWVFPLIYTLTRGGPGNATTDVYFLLYDQGFTSFDAGLASALGVLFFLLFTAVAVVGVRVMDRVSFHDD